MGKPDTLSQLRLMAQSINGRYWEREEETRRERNSPPSEKKPDKLSNQQSSSNNSKKDSKNNAKKNQSSNQGSSLSNSEKKNPNLSDKLGKDGKLTQAKRTRLRVSTSAPMGNPDPYLWVYRLSKLKLRSVQVIR